MKELGLEELGETSQCVPEEIESWTTVRKKEFLDELSATIIDKYVLDKAKPLLSVS
jgi:hypothetical protein